MKVVVAGAGTVGSNIALFLTREKHEVILVDNARSALVRAEELLDVQTIRGNACDPALLREVGMEDTDLFLSVTEADETNLIAAFTAKTLKARRVVARARSRFYMDQAELNLRAPLGIDMIISPELLAANELARFVESPTALSQAGLAEGRIQLLAVKIAPQSPYAGHKLRDVQIPEGVLIASLRREDVAMIARGDTELHPGDRVTLIGLPDALERALPKLTEVSKAARNPSVVIAGAGETGLFLAEQLERRGHDVTILEISRERAIYAGERLRKTMVLRGDATEINTLREERVGSADYYIAAMGDDENNIMSSLLAKELGTPKVACLIDRPDYTRIVQKMGVDDVISPRIVVANRVLAMVKRGRIRSVTLLEEGALEISEYQALSTSPIVGRPLRDVDMPKDALIGAMLQGNEVVIPRGDHVIRPGSIVIGVATAEASERLDALFAGQGEAKADG